MSGEIRYPVATPRAYWAVLVVLGALALAMVHRVGPRLIEGVTDHLGITLLAALIVVTPFVYFFGSSEYRTGGRRAIVLSRDAILVPDSWGVMLAFDPRATKVALTHVSTVYRVAFVPVASVPRGTVIDLVGANGRRRISTLTLVDQADAELLLSDLQRVLMGEAPLGMLPPPSPSTAPKAPRDALDDRLDEELRRLD